MTRRVPTIQPRYTCIGPAGGNPEVAPIVEAHMEALPFDCIVPEISIPEHLPYYHAVQRVAEEHAVWQMGVSVADRMPREGQIHTFRSSQLPQVAEDAGVQMEHRPGRKAWVSAFAQGRHLALGRWGTIQDIAEDAQHEVNHAASYTELRTSLIPASTGQQLTLEHGRTGYHNARSGAYYALNEIVTEMSTVDQKRNYWPKDPVLGRLDSERRTYRYLPHLILLDGILKESFEIPQARRVAWALERGMVTGEMEGLIAIRQAIGTAAMRRLARLHPTKRGAALHFAKQLGMRQTAVRIRNSDQSDLLSML